jgi:membrane protease YdiL (CAAX protease family)
MDPLASSDPATESPETASPHRFAIWGPVVTLLWTVLIGIVFVVVQFFVAVIYVIITMSELPREKVDAALAGLVFDGTFLSLGTFATLLVCVPLVLGIAKLKRNSKLTDYLGLIVPRPRQFWRWTVIIILFCVLADVISSLLRVPVPEFMIKAYTSANPRWALWLALGIAAPVFEEIFFRGFLFKGLAASRLRWPGATVITSVLWAAIHLQYGWYEISIIFALGLVLGTARAMTNSTLLTMWLHCLVNVIATAQLAFMLK